MPKRRPTRTGPHKKGYKLKGLTKSEGRQRALKSWVTKHSRYKYGAVRLDIGGNEYERQARFHAEKEHRRQKRALERSGFSEEDLERADHEARAEWEGPAEGRPIAGVSPGDIVRRPSGMSQSAWAAKVLEERDHYARYQEFKDPEFARYIRSGRVTNRERAGFIASTRQMREFMERQHPEFTDIRTYTTISEQEVSKRKADLADKTNKADKSYQRLVEAERRAREVREDPKSKDHQRALAARRLSEARTDFTVSRALREEAQHKVSMVTPIDRADKEYVGKTDETRELTHNLSQLVNPDPSDKRARSRMQVGDLTYEQRAQREISEVMGDIKPEPTQGHFTHTERQALKRRAQKYRDMANDAELPSDKARLRAKADEFDRRSELETGVRSTHGPKAAEATRISNRAEAMRQQAARTTDPAYAKLLRNRADHLENQALGALDSEQEVLKRLIDTSNFGESPAERFAAATEARKIIARLAQQAGSRRTTQRISGEIRQDYPEVERRIQGISSEDQAAIDKLKETADRQARLADAAKNAPERQRALEAERAARVQAAKIEAQYRRTSRPAHDSRLTSTVEEAYDYSGHDAQNFARSRYELAKLRANVGQHLPGPLKGKINPNEPDAGDYTTITQKGLENGKPEWLQESRQQFIFHRGQQGRRDRAVREGNLTFGRSEKGQLTPLTDKTQHKIAYGIAPNKDYEYTLRHAPGVTDAAGQRPADYTKRVEYFDKSTEFHQGRRGVAGGLVDGDWDEQVGEARVVQKHNQPLVYSEGTRRFRDPNFHREFVNKAQHDQGIDEVVITPVRGIQGHQTITRNKLKPDGTTEDKTVYYSRDPGSRVATAQDFQRTGGGWGEGTEFGAGDTRYHVINREEYDRLKEAEKSGNLTGNEPRAESALVPKKIQFVLTDPENVSLSSMQSDQISFQPFADRKKRQQAKIDAAPTGVHGIRKDSWKDQRVIMNLTPGSVRDRTVGSYVRARRQREFENRAIKARRFKDEVTVADMTSGVTLSDYEIDAEAKKQGFAGQGEVEDLAKAAVAAGIYQSRDRLVKGTIPNVANKSFNQLRKIPWVNKQFGDTWDHNVADANEAYLRPLQEKITALKYGARHPLSSQTGTSFGIDWGRWKYREHFIPEWMGGAELRETRRMERQSKLFKRVAETRSRVIKNRGKTGFSGAFHNWRSEPMMMHRDYLHFNTENEFGNSFVSKHLDFLDQYLDGNVGDIIEVEDPLTKATARVKLTKKLQDEAKLSKARINMWANEGGGAIPPRPPGSTKWTEFLPDPKKPTTIAAAVAVAALAAHYGRHKYVESKKPKDERIAYYNKVLPKAFDVPTVKIRQTGWVRTPNNAFTREFDLQNKKVAVRAGVSLQKKRIALRPMEWNEPLAPNAPIFGGIRSHKTAQGSWSKSLIFEQMTPREQRRVVRRGKPGEYGITVKGKKLPIRVEVGKREKIELKARNPHRLTQQDRDNIVWAVHGTPMEENTKNFYSWGERDRIADMLDDPNEIARVRRQKGTRETRRTERRFYSQRNR